MNKGLQGAKVQRLQGRKGTRTKKLKSFEKNGKYLYPPIEKMIDFAWADPRVYYIITQHL